MKKCFYPLVTIALVFATFFLTGCPPSRADLLAEIKDIQEGGQMYKEHEKQDDKYTIPNASLAASRALYLPIGGALSDMVNETVGNEYLRSYLLVQTSGTAYTKIWGNIRKKFSDEWMAMKTAERMAFLANWEGMKKRLNDSTVSNPMTQAEFDAVVNSFSKEEKSYYDFYEAESVIIANLGLNNRNEKGEYQGFMQNQDEIDSVKIRMKDQIEDIDSIPDNLLKFEVINELVKIKRTQEACVFMDEKEKDRPAYFEKKAKNGDGEAWVKWLGLNEAHNDSTVYSAYLDRKRATEEEISKEREKALVTSFKEDGKVAAFSSYWLADIGKIAYPILGEELPGQVGAIIRLTAPVANIALDETKDRLEKEYDWLPTSLNVDFNAYPALKSQFGSDVSLQVIMANVGKLLDQEKIETIAAVITTDFTDPGSILGRLTYFFKAGNYSYALVNQVYNDVSDDDYGQVVLDVLGVLGNQAGQEFVSAMNGELKHYNYANDIAMKRIEYTAKALKWVSGNSMEKFFRTLSAE